MPPRSSRPPTLHISGRGQGHRQPRLVTGQIFRTMISMQSVLYNLAWGVAARHNIRLTSPPPVYDPCDERNFRPCIFLYCSDIGIHVLPMATFRGSEPETWNLLLQEVVVPVGNRTASMFDERRAFQTIPDWRHPKGWNTYVVPQVVVLSYHTHLFPLPVTMPVAVADDLGTHCNAIINMLYGEENGRIRRVLRSYEERPTGTYRTQSDISEEPADGDFPTAGVSQIASQNPHLRGRAAGSEIGSFPGMANSQFAGQAWSVGSRSVASSQASSARGRPQAPITRQPSRLR